MKELLMVILLSQQNECMTEALYHEARGEGFDGMVHVAAVIHNRVLDKRWPDTICGVVHQPYQFSYRNAGTSFPMNDEEALERAEEISEAIINSDGKPLLNNILYYHATRVTPRWDYNKLEELFVVGNHVFYTDGEN